MKIQVYKNNGETTVIETKKFDEEAVHEAMKDPKVDSVKIGRNIYKTHMIQSVEVIEE